MPNTPMLVKKGASVYVKGKNATSADAKVTRRLLESVGICEEVPETYLDPVTALSGSGILFESCRRIWTFENNF